MTNLRDVLIRPLITEKTNAGMQSQCGGQVCNCQIALDQAGGLECGAGIHDTAPPTTSA